MSESIQGLLAERLRVLFGLLNSLFLRFVPTVQPVYEVSPYLSLRWKIGTASTAITATGVYYLINTSTKPIKILFGRVYTSLYTDSFNSIGVTDCGQRSYMFQNATLAGCVDTANLSESLNPFCVSLKNLVLPANAAIAVNVAVHVGAQNLVLQYAYVDEF